MKDEAVRHEADELNWHIILLLELFKIENNHLVQRLLYMSTESGKFSWLRWGASEAERIQMESTETNELINSIPGLENSKERIEQLIKAWRERLTISNTATLNYQAMFALAPHYITWGEFKQFFTDWRASRSLQKIQNFITERASSNRGLAISVQEELASTVLEYHAILMERASHVGTAEMHTQLINEATDTLDFFDHSFCGTKPYLALSSIKLQACWDKLYETALSWAHFVRNDGEPKLRATELTTLIRIAETLKKPLAIYDRLIRGMVSHSPFGKDQREKREALIGGIRNHCESQALSAAYEFIKQPRKITNLRSNSEDQGARFILTSPKSIAFSEAEIATTKSVWKSRHNTDGATDDALTFLELLLVAYENGDRYCTKNERATFSRANSEFIITIWDLCISRQLQFRMLSEMRKIREAFVAQGIDTTKLVIPDWLSAE
jgi:hypothetical protein